MNVCVYEGATLLAVADYALLGGAPEQMKLECDLALEWGPDHFCGPPGWAERQRQERRANDGAAS